MLISIAASKCCSVLLLLQTVSFAAHASNGTPTSSVTVMHEWHHLLHICYIASKAMSGSASLDRLGLKQLCRFVSGNSRSHTSRNSLTPTCWFRFVGLCQATAGHTSRNSLTHSVQHVGSGCSVTRQRTSMPATSRWEMSWWRARQS